LAAIYLCCNLSCLRQLLYLLFTMPLLHRVSIHCFGTPQYHNPLVKWKQHDAPHAARINNFGSWGPKLLSRGFGHTTKKEGGAQSTLCQNCLSPEVCQPSARQVRQGRVKRDTAIVHRLFPPQLASALVPLNLHRPLYISFGVQLL